MVKSPKYAARLAPFGDTFIKRKDDILRQLNVHIIRAVDAANEKLDVQATTLGSIKGQLSMVALFQ